MTNQEVTAKDGLLWSAGPTTVLRDTMKNQDIARILYEIADLLELDGVAFKPRAYRRAAQTVDELPEPIEAVAERGELKELPGVGEAIAKKIEQIVETGHLAYHDELKAKLPIDLAALTGVEGVGPKTARLLYQALGIRTLDDLERAARAEQLREVPGLGRKTEEKILRGIAEARRVEHRVSLWSGLSLARGLCSRLEATGRFTRLEAAGSLRRGRETVGDLDLLAVSGDPEAASRAFVSLPDVEEVLARGEKKASVRIGGGLQVDLRLVPEESFGAALQYFTGSKEHNVALRELAISRGWKLNEYGLFDEAGHAVAGRTETEIYEALGLDWIPPELRENEGEIRAAERRELPTLVAREDIRSDLHVHTNFSDGSGSIEEMVSAARARGLSYIAVTDHFRFAEVIGGLCVDDLRRERDEIESVNERLKGFRILCGVEANIGKAGALDVPGDLMGELDLVVAAVHSHFRLSRKESTDRLLRAIDTEGVDILAHPTGRKIGQRPAVDADWDRIFRRAAETGVALEINANPERLDLQASLIREAIAAGARLTIGTDAHAPDHLDFLELGVLTARRGWAAADQVLNTLAVDEFLAALRRSRGGG